MAPEPMAERMRQLSARFLNGLSDELKMIASDPAAAAGIVHRITGRAGTFGFPEISAAAEQLEEIIAVDGAAGPAFVAGLAALHAIATRAGAAHD